MTRTATALPQTALRPAERTFLVLLRRDAERRRAEIRRAAEAPREPAAGHKAEHARARYGID